MSYYSFINCCILCSAWNTRYTALHKHFLSCYFSYFVVLHYGTKINSTQIGRYVMNQHKIAHNSFIYSSAASHDWLQGKQRSISGANARGGVHLGQPFTSTPTSNFEYPADPIHTPFDFRRELRDKSCNLLAVRLHCWPLHYRASQKSIIWQKVCGHLTDHTLCSYKKLHYMRLF